MLRTHAQRNRLRRGFAMPMQALRHRSQVLRVKRVTGKSHRGTSRCWLIADAGTHRRRGHVRPEDDTASKWRMRVALLVGAGWRSRLVASHKPSVDGGLRPRKLRCGMVRESRGQEANRARVFAKCVTCPALNPEQIAGTLVRRRARLRACAVRRACCRRARLALLRHPARYACAAAGRASARGRPL